MADKNVFRGLSDAQKVAVLLELVITAASVNSAINTALDSLTEAGAQAALASFSAREKRAQWGA